jgi:hypothetical protein
MNSIYARFRNQAFAVQGADAMASARLSSSINPNIGNFYFRINQFPYPSYLIIGYLVGSGAEGMTELQKSFRSLTSLTGEPCIKANEYNVSSSAYASGQWALAYAPHSRSAGYVGTEANGFAIGLELQSYSNCTDTIMSGINTLGAQMLFTANIYNDLTAGGTGGYTYSVDFFAGYDLVMKIEDGVIMVIT